MNPKILVPAGALALAQAFVVSAASAQESSRGYFQDHVEPPRKALELSVGTGYTQGFGLLTRYVGMQDVVNEGIALNLDIGYRIDPHWLVGAMGEYQEFDSPKGPGTRGVVTGLQAAYHLMPSDRVDPWVSFGSGYRWLWQTAGNPSNTVLTQGLQMGRLLVGVDIRASQDVAIAPVIGADLDTFLAQGNGGVSDPRLSTFLHAGLMGRFDLGGEKPSMTASNDFSDFGVTERQPVAVGVFLSPWVNVSSELAAACDLRGRDAAGFGFDDAALSNADREALKLVAACFTTGPLKGASMVVVGRADPRGAPTYNMELGARRAANVTDFLTAQGIDRGRMAQSSRGALDATGHDEAGWAFDRRVDIDLVR